LETKRHINNGQEIAIRAVGVTDPRHDIAARRRCCAKREACREQNDTDRTEEIPHCLGRREYTLPHVSHVSYEFLTGSICEQKIRTSGNQWG
jgi:hypothetical protein